MIRRTVYRITVEPPIRVRDIARGALVAFLVLLPPAILLGVALGLAERLATP